jgi:epoxyqueuosine reductase
MASSEETKMDKSEMTALIEAKAIEIGFDAIGFARAEELSFEREGLERWLADGMHAEMKWMERDPARRSDPRLVMPGAKSVIVVLVNYYTPHQHDSAGDSGKISRYAWGDDYHDVVGEKLKMLGDFITKMSPESKIKYSVDTSAILEKHWAVRAGLGWIGKHSNLITKDLGSWVFIGEILTDLELDESPETIENHCGTCTACIDACPTDAIVSDYVVDSRRCISYATIESRAPLMPDEIAENLDGWLYGCDICQDVCPWNRFQKVTSEEAFQPRAGEASMNLDEVLSFKEEDFSERFNGSGIKRAKLSGLQRNARTLRNIEG